MDTSKTPHVSLLRVIFGIAIGLAILGGLLLSRMYSYLLFHSLSELFSAVVGFGIFIIAWNSDSLSKNSYLTVLGIGSLFIAVIDLIHVLAFKGMGIFTTDANIANLPTQLWLAARYLQALTFLFAALVLRRRIGLNFTLASYLLITGMLLASIFLKIFPAAYIEGSGLTSFKIFSEYVIIGFLAFSGFLLWLHRKEFDRDVLGWMSVSIFSSIVAELAFTQYLGVTDTANMLGHLSKIVAFYAIYRAVVETAFVRPYNLIFRELKQSETNHREARAEALALMQDAVAARQQVEEINEKLQREIAERKQAEEHFERNSQKLNEILTSIQDDFYVLDRDWNFVYASSLFTSKIGKEPEDFVGKNIWEMFPRHVGTVLEENFHAAMEKREVRRFELGGKYTAAWYRMTVFPSTDGITILGTDITERKQAEEALQQKESDLREAQRIAHIGSWYWDASTDVTTGSDELLRIYGFNPATQTMPDFNEQRGRCYPVEEWKRVNAAVQRTLETGVGYEMDVKAIRNDIIIWVTTRSEVVRDDEGQIVGLRGTVQDITDRKIIDEALFESRKQNEFLADIIRNSSQSLSIGYPDGKLDLVNNAFQELTGYTAAELQSIDWIAKLTPPEWQEIEAEKLAGLLSTGQPVRYEKEYIRKDGTRVPIELLVHLVKDAEGNPQYYYSFITDISERKKSEAELRRLASFPERNPNPVVEVGYSGDIVYLNPKSQELFPDIASLGFRHPILAGLEQFVHKFEEGWPKTLFIQDVKTGDAYYQQSIVNISDGRRIRLYHVDITERKRVEEALQHSQTILLETGKVAKVGGWELDLQTRQLVWTLETYCIHEVDASLQPDLNGAIDFYAPEARPRIAEAVRQAIEEGKSYDLELPLITAKGRHIWVRTIGQPEFRDGMCVRLFGTFQDITETRQAEEGLRRFELLSANSKDIILFMRREDGIILEGNAAAIQVYGYSRDELLALSIGDLRAPGTRGLTVDQMTQADAKGILFETVHLRKDGSTFPVEVSSQGATIGGVRTLISIVRDITERKKVEETLAHQAEDLRRSNIELEQFAYVASHDLQEPLRIMASYSQLLEKRYRGRLDTDADEFIEFIVDAAARMQKLITDLLAYSRAGRETTELAEVDCNKILRKLVTNMAAIIEATDGIVTFDRLPSIMTHETSLNQLFQNLIGNALKFRSEQPPIIHICAKKEGCEWVFSVHDNGIGLEPQYSQRIFMIFQRLHPRDKYPGTGIGLSICKKIVDNMGGRIWVESEPGQGSTFCFAVPEKIIVAAKILTGE